MAHTTPDPAARRTSGNGTYTGPDADEETIDEPVLDGANETNSPSDNPRFGMDDPGLVRNTETGEKTPIPDETR